MADASGDAGVAPARDPHGACRINALSDGVLLRALSHLDALQVVQTSLLSRRWRGLWRSVPRINATCHDFEIDDMADTDMTMFKAFVNRVLMLRNPVALDELRLVYHLDDGSADCEADSEDANLWIRHALRCGARSVQISGLENELHLESAVFASECFLTSLQLQYVLLVPGFFSSLQIGCKLLERLILKCCTINDPDISSQTLKFFTMDGDCHCTFEGQASISIPSLTDLHFSNYDTIPLLNSMESLVTASVSVGDAQVDDIHQLLAGLSSVTELKFYYGGARLRTENGRDWCPQFNNLMTLTLDEWCLHANFYALIILLQNSPNLVELTLKFRERNPWKDQKFLGDPEVRSFTCKHLQTVCLKGSMDEDDLTINSLKKLLLDNGITSDQIEIVD